MAPGIGQVDHELHPRVVENLVECAVSPSRVVRRQLLCPLRVSIHQPRELELGIERDGLEIEVGYVQTKETDADMFTKPLEPVLLSRIV